MTRISHSPYDCHLCHFSNNSSGKPCIMLLKSVLKIFMHLENGWPRGVRSSEDAV
ncbi:unnamed protein product [Nesidiocoris tenuis]|uniref:Uncharacterized protein n=1 Tax=Nesidiocoris tenuis TaxID=355587 RepID=A0A6H5G6Y7_9HEMI|nr:unnamed protein product [Nesidiocoris tenuis]